MTVAAVSFGRRISQRGDRVWEIEVPCAEGRAFYKLAVYPLREAAFRKACKEGLTVALSDYGDIVESGYIVNTSTTSKNEAA